MRFSLPEFLSGVSADATAIGLDMPDGGYDRLHAFLERQGNLPTTKAGRTALIAVMLVASRLAKQQFGGMGPLANFFNEIAEDGVREEAKRILTGMSREDLETILSILTPETAKQPGMMDRIATSFFPWLKDKN